MPTVLAKVYRRRTDTRAFVMASCLVLCLALGVAAGPVARYLEATARSLHQPDTYVRTVLAARAHAEEPP